MLFDPPFGKTYRWSLAIIILFECLSFAAWLHPALASPAFIAIVGGTLLLAFVRFDLAMLVLLGELFIGSQGGSMLFFGAGSGLYLSLRMGLFLAVAGAWLATAAAASVSGGDPRRAAWVWWVRLRRHGVLWPYLALLVAVGIGVIRGITLGNGPSNVFFDANAYAFYALLPAFVVAFENRTLWRRAAAVLAAAITDAVFKALIVMFLFAHRMAVPAKAVYLWIRDTRVGEITIMVADFFRVFFQSQVFPVWILYALLLLLAYRREWKARAAKGMLVLLVGVMIAMLLSLSRSFWFGTAVAAAALAALLVWGRAEARIWKRLIVLFAGSMIAAALVITALYAFPWPARNGSLSLAMLFGDRFSLDDAAAHSRWALLPKLTAAAMRHPILGSGFGTLVTYTASDPRILATMPNGQYTTYAFEWGYHDIWLKLGVVGLAIYAWFLAAILKPFALAVRSCRDSFRSPDLDDERKEKAILAAGLALGTIAVLATNLFSPYLNHPLGIGIFMLIAVLGIYEFSPPSALPTKSG